MSRIACTVGLGGRRIKAGRPSKDGTHFVGDPKDYWRKRAEIAGHDAERWRMNVNMMLRKHPAKTVSEVEAAIEAATAASKERPTT